MKTLHTWEKAKARVEQKPCSGCPLPRLLEMMRSAISSSAMRCRSKGLETDPAAVALWEVQEALRHCIEAMNHG